MERSINRCLEEIKEAQEKVSRLDSTLTRDTFDNASKTSSGYGDEESNEDVSGYTHGIFFDKDEVEDNGQGVIAMSDGEVWEFRDSVFSKSHCSIDESTYATILKKNCLKVVNPLPLYPPSEEIKIAQYRNFSTKSLHENHTDIIKTFLTDFKLHKDNIHFVYKMLLEMEDVTCMSEYVPLMQKDVILNCSDVAREYWISLKDCPNIDYIVSPLIDEVVLVPKTSDAICEIVSLKYKIDILLPHKDEQESCVDLFRRRLATVQKITKGRAYFRFSKNENLSASQLDALLTTKYNIIFRSRRYNLRYQHHALQSLSFNHKIREYLFPEENPNKELMFQPKLTLSLFNAKIATNPEQLKAVHCIVNGTNLYAPFVIFGPPGTGKTTTTVESILQLRLRQPNSRILVTAGSNSACDTIALQICKYIKSNRCLKQLEINDPQHQKSLIRIYSKSIVEKGIKLIHSDLLKYSNCDNGVHYYPSVEDIHQYGIIVATSFTVGKLVTGGMGKLNFFTHIFMDEAGASTIPEALVGVMGIKSYSDCRLILSGDHRQLGPIIKSERASQLGLKHSLMEHLLSFKCYDTDENFNYDCTLQARLRRNYRSHPEIVRLYNHLYYNGELIAEATEEDVNLAANWCKLPNPKFPIIFQAVHGVTEKDNISPSSFNNLEIKVLTWFLQRLLVDGINGCRVHQTDIGIITPYNLQNKLIQKRLNERGWSNVESGSVETFQGREKQIIIASLVRSFAGLGFVSNPKRLNVLLSRPKSLLILIGNPLTLRRHSDFAFILNECQRHGTFLRKNKTGKYTTKLSTKLI